MFDRRSILGYEHTPPIGARFVTARRPPPPPTTSPRFPPTRAAGDRAPISIAVFALTPRRSRR